MLYDQALLALAYIEVYQATGNPAYEQIVREIFTYVLRDMTDPNGGFYSAEDADSEGEEGKFYVWTTDEIDQVLGMEADLFKSFYGVTPTGNWEEGKNVLKMSKSLKDLTEEFKLSEDEIGKKLKAAREILFRKREERVRPSLDDKQLTSWNALMITGLTHAYEASGDEKYRKLALASADFILAELYDGSRLKRTFKDGKATINAFLDDYTFLVSAFNRLYSITFDKAWLQRADRLLEVVLEEFKQAEADFFNFKSSKDEPLFAIKQVLEDNVIPAANSVMANNLHKLYLILGEPKYLNYARKMLQQITPQFSNYPMAFANWGTLMLKIVEPYFEIIVSGTEAKTKLQQMQTGFQPHVLWAFSSTESDVPVLKDRFANNQTLIYVCEEGTCQLPVEKPEKALELIKW
jgi:uncharacterized protein YyaL (SSP411 family)